MDERDAKRTGVPIVRKDMAFAADYVSCATCACNYDMQTPDGRSFCQIYSMTIDPADTKKNEFTASACDQWVRDGLDRNKVITPDHKYRYDDWDAP